MYHIQKNKVMLFIEENMRFCDTCLEYRNNAEFDSSGENICYRHDPVVPVAIHENFCKKCQAFSSIDNFKRTGYRKFLCDTHINLMLQQYKKKIDSNGWKKEITRVYSLCRDDAKKSFKHPTINLKKGDISQLFAGSYFTDGHGKTEQGKFDLAVMPLRPHEILSIDNATFVTRHGRSTIIKKLKWGSWDKYEEMIDKMGLK